MNRSFVVLLLSAALLGACVDAPRVVQGSVMGYERSSKILSLRDELPPRSELRISLAGAEVGAEPTVGDTVRLAYREHGGQLTALRLANISRQAEIGGKAAAKKSH